MREAISRCLGHLLPDRRHALVLYLQGHSVAETARLLGATDKRAENLIYRGRAEVQECLKRQGVEPGLA